MSDLDDAANNLLTAAQPSGEIASAGVTGRDAHGRFQSGNTAALIHGGRSMAASTLQAGLRRDIRARVLSDLGLGEDDVPVTLGSLVDRFAEVTLLCATYFTWLEDQGGPIGTRGRQKAAVKGY